MERSPCSITAHPSPSGTPPHCLPRSGRRPPAHRLHPPKPLITHPFRRLAPRSSREGLLIGTEIALPRERGAPIPPELSRDRQRIHGSYRLLRQAHKLPQALRHGPLQPPLHLLH